MTFVLEADQITKYFGANRIFNQISFKLKEGEKAGLVGPNGAGKTTLLNCLAGRESMEEGTVRIAPYTSIGFLEQTQDSGDTLLSFVMSVFSDVFNQRKHIEELEQAMGDADEDELEELLVSYGNERERYERAEGFSAETQVRRVLSGLGFLEEQFLRPVVSFSGGEKTRIGLARVLVREYPLLFLDEPTNHLDLPSVEWLEGFLQDYRGALLIVSHDRYFLDKVTETIFDLDNGKLKRYDGSYSRFAEQRDEEYKTYVRAYEKQQKEIGETEAFIQRYQYGIKARQARGRQTRLNRLERMEKPGRRREMNMGKASVSGQTGEKVLILDQLSYSYTNKRLFSGLSAEIRFGERVALLGPNGAGKTTILELITGRLNLQSGGIYIGPSVKPAYFDQEHRNLHPDHTVLQEILMRYDLTIEEAKAYLARFLFFAEELDKPIIRLSGGERGRLSLLKLTLEKSNFLILDEPTNHLDIQSREVMEEYLSDYPGTLLIVSHDRYFLDTLADRVIEITPEGLVSHAGNYSDYHDWKERMARLERKDKDEQKNPRHKKPADPKPLDRYARANLRRRIQELEAEINSMEEEEAGIVESLSNPDIYGENDSFLFLREWNERLNYIHGRLPEAYGEWEEIGRLLEEE